MPSLSTPVLFLARFWKRLAAIPAALLALAGLATLAAGIVAAQLIQDRGLALTAMGFGSFTGALLLSLYLPRALYAFKEQMESELAKLRQTKEQLDQAKKEIARLERMKLNVDAFRGIARLGLLELDLSIRDHQRLPLKTEPKAFLRKERQHVYAGLVKIPVRAQLGIDLSKAKIEERSGTLHISNLVPFHSYELGTAEWEFDEIRIEHRDHDSVTEVTIDPADRRAKEHARAQESQIRQRLEQGVYVKPYEDSLLKHAEVVIRQLLAPLGMPLVFLKEASAQGVDLLKYLNDEVAEHQLSADKS